jgi:hypothetical protein
MATQEHPLLSLEPAKQQQLVDLVESNDIEDIATKTGLTRRQILGIGATLAGSGALGGFAATEAINPAQAQADTGDSDGNVGLPTDRVDVFADGIDSNSLNTDEGTVNGKDLPGIPATSNDPGLSLGTWRQASTSRAAIVMVSAQAVTDGSTTGEVDVEIDESGGTSGDWQGVISRAPSAFGTSVGQFDSLLVLLPPNAQYRYLNISDPNSANSVQFTREFVL